MAPGYPGANRREARKLGLLRSKSSEAERERMKPQERNERVCGGCPGAMLILMEYGPGYIIFVARGYREKRGVGNCSRSGASILGFIGIIASLQGVAIPDSRILVG